MDARIKQLNRVRRHRRTRAGVLGTKSKPRAAIFKSNRNIFIQLIDDESGKTLISNKRDTKSKGKKTDNAMLIGEMVGKRAIEKGIKEVFFDKGGYKYHGRVKAAAEGLRKAGLNF